MRSDHGFTLLELIAVIVVLSVGLAGLATLFGNANFALARGENVQQAAQFAQECAERVIGVRRDLGFTSTDISSAMCGADPAGFARTLTLSAVYVGTSATPCPDAASCRDVTVTVSRDGAVQSEIMFMLAQY